jgi:polysaccharide biosynthesis/export protein
MKNITAEPQRSQRPQRINIYIFLCVLCVLCVSAVKKDLANAAELEPRYIIQPNDMLEVFVWQEPALTRKVLVRPDGFISIPLVQDIQAAGITPAELKVALEKKLKEYLPAPNVTIVVDAIQSYRVYVVGKVQKPGSITVEKPVTVLQALSLAGGFQDYAKDSEIVVIRTNEKESIVLEFNYRDVIHGKNPEQNILLRSGDVVAVP